MAESRRADRARPRRRDSRLRGRAPAFDVEWSCLGGFGVITTDGDAYLAGFATIMAFGWLIALVGIVYAEIADNRRAAAAIPAVWFATLVALAVVWAAAIGPERCPA